jgi:Zn-dependent protease
MLGLDIATLISRAIILVIAFTAHEFAHAASADWFGDDTPRLNGRLTLNPLVHLDPLGSLLLLVAGFGWARPVPVNPYALERRNPYAPMWVALAGPLSNLLLAVLAAIPFRLGLVSLFGPSGEILPTPSQFLAEFIFLNLILLLFNLIPIFPLDGEKVLTYLLPADSRGTLEQIRPYGPMILMLLIFIGPWLGLDLLTLVIGQPVRALFSILIG